MGLLPLRSTNGSVVPAKHNLLRLPVLQGTPMLCKKPHDFSTLQLFNHQRFANYWFETGTPTFLIKLIKTRQCDIEPFEHLEVPELTFNTYEIESLDLIPLLFQTGYLTIKGLGRDRFGEIYTLSYPNMVVAQRLLTFARGQ